ncbi:alcohol dehydrogenase catalytic domain-containing protein [Roseateles sp. GG27B]
MKAWLCENPVGVEALTWQELPTPAPSAGHIRVAIKAASLNFPDLLIIQNKYQFKPALPFVPGTEFAGVVDAVGDGDRFIGDAVAAFAGRGFASHAASGSAGPAAATGSTRMLRPLRPTPPAITR